MDEGKELSCFCWGTVRGVKSAVRRSRSIFSAGGVHNGLMKKSRGLTLIELMVTVALAAMLAGLAAPALSSLMANRSMSAALDAMVSDFRYARSEALKRSAPVSICRSATGTSCAAGSWHSGWLVFVESAPGGSIGVVDAGDEILRVQSGLSGLSSIAAPGGGNINTAFTFRQTGVAVSGGNVSAVLTPTGSVTSTGTRLLCINAVGRASVRAQGVTACL